MEGEERKKWGKKDNRTVFVKARSVRLRKNVKIGGKEKIGNDGEEDGERMKRESEEDKWKSKRENEERG